MTGVLHSLLAGTNRPVSSLVFLPSTMLIVDFVGAPGTVQAGLQLTSGGEGIFVRLFQGNSTEFTWLRIGSSGDYQVRVSSVSGTLDSTSDAANTWLSLSATRTWLTPEVTSGTTTVTFTLEIRDTATNTVRAASSVTLTAEIT